MSTLIPTRNAPEARSPRLGLLAVLVAGAALRTWQALGLDSLWRDEVALGLNFDARHLAELLLHPLEHQQMAPPGFLASVELATTLVGGPTGSAAPDLAFRFVPWLLGLAGLVAAWLALRRVSRGWTLVAALVPFALGTGAVYYGAAVKPYGADVAACLLLLWASLRHLDAPTDRRTAALGGALVGPMLLFSFPAVPLATCLALVLALVLGLHSRRSAALRAWLRLVVPWGVFAGLSSVFVVRLRGGELHGFMVDYWRAGFPDWDRPLDAALFFPRHAAGSLQHFLFFRGPELAPPWLLAWMKVAVVAVCLLAVWGAVSTLRRSPWRAAVLLAPLALAGLLAALRIYPLLERLGLWTAPSVLLLAAAGVARVTASLARRPRLRRTLAAAWMTAAAVIFSPLVLSTFWLQLPPTETQAVRPVVEELTRRVQPGDVVYVPCGAGQLGLRSYARRSGLDRRAEIVEGTCHATRDGYLREAASMAGRSRVWLFYSLRPRGRAEWVLAAYEDQARRVGHIPDPHGRSGVGSTRALLFDLAAYPSRSSNRNRF